MAFHKVQATHVRSCCLETCLKLSVFFLLYHLIPVYTCLLQLETVGWQLSLQMAHSAEAKLRSPQAVLRLGVSNEDSKVRKGVPWK